jgi:hypothetical protein
MAFALGIKGRSGALGIKWVVAAHLGTSQYPGSGLDRPIRSQLAGGIELLEAHGRWGGEVKGSLSGRYISILVGRATNQPTDRYV